jgi:hypothetical protein
MYAGIYWSHNPVYTYYTDRTLEYAQVYMHT